MSIYEHGSPGSPFKLHYISLSTVRLLWMIDDDWLVVDLSALLMALAQESLALQRAGVQATWSQEHKGIGFSHLEGHGTVNATNDIQMRNLSKHLISEAAWLSYALIFEFHGLCLSDQLGYRGRGHGMISNKCRFRRRTHFPAP